jgi:hypothetical protein
MLRLYNFQSQVYAHCLHFPLIHVAQLPILIMNNDNKTY